VNSEVSQDNEDSFRQELPLLGIASLVVRRRLVIISCTFVGTLLALVIALTAKFEYTATASFLPHQGDQGGFSGASSLAQQFGLSMPRSADAGRSPQFYQDLLESRNVLDALAQSGVEVPSPSGPRTIDLAEHFRIQNQVPDIRRALVREELAAVIATGFALTTSVVTVSIRTSDPDVSSGIGRRLLELISEFDMGTRQSQASAEGDFSEERLGQLQTELLIVEDSLKSFLNENRAFDNSPSLQFERDRLMRQVVMRQELVSAMAQAFEQARIDQVRNTPVITVIDEPNPPEMPNARGRLTTLILGVILGMLTGFGLALAREFSERVSHEDGDTYREFKDVLADAKRDPIGIRNARARTPSAQE
jgi:uncharacterized protein involved in exopolysaccharide biosynthesis